MKNVKNKTVWITGASDGIGAELARQMAEEGARIILTARNEAKLKSVKSELKGDGHVIHPMDLLETKAIPKAVEEVLAKVNHVDILVNNAGISQRSLAKDTSEEVDRKIMELDFFAVNILNLSLTLELSLSFLFNSHHLSTNTSKGCKVNSTMPPPIGKLIKQRIRSSLHTFAIPSEAK